MDENLVGYLLNALDPETQRAVEGHLRLDAGARRKLEQFRQALEPLAADRENLVPSPGLRVRTLARVAEYRCRGAARVPPAPPVRPPSPISASWWRRADVLVAASLLLICLASLLPWLARVQRKRTILECQNNLRAIYLALQGYSDHHGGALPKVEEVPPANFAGIFIPTLYQDGVLANVSVACPGTGRAAPTLISLDELERLSRIQPGKYAQYVREIGGCYAYPLGYRQDGELCGLRLDPDQRSDRVPVMADRPPFDRPDSPDLFDANSENHGGEGQNVLHLAGNVEFYMTRYTRTGDDIYLNRNQLLEPGVNSQDIVLAASGVRASPTVRPDH